MSEISRPWSGTAPGDAGPYSAQQWQTLYQYIIGLGASRANVGPVLGSGTQPKPALNVQAQAPATTSIDVLPGSALVQGIAYINTGTVSFAIAANSSGSARIDTIVLQADYALQTVRLAVLQGTPAGSPVPPTLTQSANVLWEIPIADIAVANGFTSITNANITPRHEFVNAANGVYLDNVLNNSGVTLQTGDVVIWDTTADRAITTTTTADDTKLAGIWIGRTANGSYGRVQTAGIGYVNGVAAITRGNLLQTSTTAKQAKQNTNGVVNASIGRALETTSGAGFCLTAIAVWTQPSTTISFAVIEEQQAQNTAGGGSTATTWTTRVLNTEVADADNIVSINTNLFTPIAGTYRMRAESPFVEAANQALVRIRLWNNTAGSEVARSTNFFLGNATSSGVTATLDYIFTANGTDAYAIQYFVTVARVTNGLGAAINEASAVERYTRVMLEKIG